MASVRSSDSLRAFERATALSTLIRQRRLAPSCGGLAPTAERTVGPARILKESLTPYPGIREQNRSKCDSATTADCYRVSGVIRKLSLRPKSATSCAPIVTRARPSPMPALLPQRSPTKSIQSDSRDRRPLLMTQTLRRRAKRLEMRASLPTMSAIGSQIRPLLSQHPMAAKGQRAVRPPSYCPRFFRPAPHGVVPRQIWPVMSDCLISLRISR
jgi:hypothetical protein